MPQYIFHREQQVSRKRFYTHHRSLVHSAIVEQKHHGQTHDDVFLCIPPLYHTGAKMHWFGSLISGGKAVLLKGIKPEWILTGGVGRRMYNSMAFSAVGTGYT